MTDKKKVVFTTPTVTKPFPQYLAALEASVPAVEAAGYEHSAVWEIGNPYIGAARATMLRKALDAKADIIVFIDHDVSWQPEDMVALIDHPGDVVSGTYRFKIEPEEYMGAWSIDATGRPLVRGDGTLVAEKIPAGFLKITKECVDRFMKAYPKLMYGPAYSPAVDLFNHGAHEGVFWGEDYAFSRNWLACGGEIHLVPNLNITHHSGDKAFAGNLHEFLMRQPGGSKCP